MKSYTQEMIKGFLDGHNLKGPNFDETPQRVAKMWDVFFSRYTERPDLKFFPSKNKEMMIMKNHIAWGFCPHHLVPVRYTFKIAYVPNGKVVGLSKLARLAEYHLTNLPLQEELTELIVDDLEASIQPEACACLIRGYHLCAVMRGIKSEDVEFITQSFRGDVTENMRREFLSL